MTLLFLVNLLALPALSAPGNDLAFQMLWLLRLQYGTTTSAHV